MGYDFRVMIFRVSAGGFGKTLAFLPDPDARAVTIGRL
jgi:hypothetical protein